MEDKQITPEEIINKVTGVENAPAFPSNPTPSGKAA